jgi:hypothetical protein
MAAFMRANSYQPRRSATEIVRFLEQSEPILLNREFPPKSAPRFLAQRPRNNCLPNSNTRVFAAATFNWASHSPGETVDNSESPGSGTAKTDRTPPTTSVGFVSPAGAVTVLSRKVRPANLKFLARVRARSDGCFSASATISGGVLKTERFAGPVALSPVSESLEQFLPDQ